jgi:S-adenosylmethionine synthetase
MNMSFDLYSIESVTNGHPDKVCDQISDAILDEALTQDPLSRVAIESFGGHGLLTIGGELTTNAEIDYEDIARKLYTKIGYSEELEIRTRIVKQSPDIALGVNTGGAGDQGIMYGYATNASNDFLPFGYGLVNKLTKGLQTLRETKKLKWLRPDGKAQVTIKSGQLITVLISTQHKNNVSQEQIRSDLISNLINPILEREAIKESGIEILINPTGKFVQGGFEADTGLTGRKIMIDTYGGLYPHGGGCFSGKDPTKVDRSAAYMARFVAKNLVANGYANECIVSVAYAIGRAEPLMVSAINETGKMLDKQLLKQFDFRPLAIIERLNLRRPIYLQTAAYGHFTKPDLPWEQIVKI